MVDDHLQRLIPRLEAGELDLALIYDHEAIPDISARDLERIPLLDDVPSRPTRGTPPRPATPNTRALRAER